jgi:hypothetical protein
MTLKPSVLDILIASIRSMNPLYTKNENIFTVLFVRYKYISFKCSAHVSHEELSFECEGTAITQRHNGVHLRIAAELKYKCFLKYLSLKIRLYK